MKHLVRLQLAPRESGGVHVALADIAGVPLDTCAVIPPAMVEALTVDRATAELVLEVGPCAHDLSAS